MDKRIKYLLILAAAIIIAVILFPKECGYSYGGFVSAGMEISREDCSCLGYKYSKVGDAFGFAQCLDCAATEYCMGLPIGNECYTMKAGEPANTEKMIECK